MSRSGAARGSGATCPAAVAAACAPGTPAAPPPPGPPRRPARPAPRRPAARPRGPGRPRAPRRAPPLPLRRRGLAGTRRREGPGLADRLAHLRDLPGQRGELLVGGQLAAHLLHLFRLQLPAGGAPARHRLGPQPPRPVAAAARLGAATAARLAAAAPVLADAAAPEVANRGQPLEQPRPPGLQLGQLGTGHQLPPFWLFDPQPDYATTSLNSKYLQPCLTPGGRRRSGASARCRCRLRRAGRWPHTRRPASGPR